MDTQQSELYDYVHIKVSRENDSRQLWVDNKSVEHVLKLFSVARQEVLYLAYLRLLLRKRR